LCGNISFVRSLSVLDLGAVNHLVAYAAVFLFAESGAGGVSIGSTWGGVSDGGDGGEGGGGI
jgi:hypothetical protein